MEAAEALESQPVPDDGAAEPEGLSLTLSSVAVVPPSLVPPGPAPHQTFFSFTNDWDLYSLANWLFLLNSAGYLLGDLARVLWPRELILGSVGNNWSNAWFLLWAIVLVIDCVLYLIVYAKWEKEALEEQEVRKRILGEHGVDEDDEGHVSSDGADDHEHGEDGDENRQMLMDENSGVGDSGGIKRRRGKSFSNVPPPSSSITARLLSLSQSLFSNARWYFFAFEGGLVNVFEVLAALIFLVDATISFMVGILNVDRVVQRKWDTISMTGDVIGSVIFFADSIAWHHIYLRTLSRPFAPSFSRDESTPDPPVPSHPISCLQPRDPYFWTTLGNVIGCVIYVFGSSWGLARQLAIVEIDIRNPGVYDETMTPMLRILHGAYFSGDIAFAFSGACLIYAYARDCAASAEESFDPDGDGGTAAAGAAKAISRAPLPHGASGRLHV